MQIILHPTTATVGGRVLNVDYASNYQGQGKRFVNGAVGCKQLAKYVTAFV